jgi:hypothetical protein
MVMINLAPTPALTATYVITRNMAMTSYLSLKIAVKRTRISQEFHQDQASGVRQPGGVGRSDRHQAGFSGSEAGEFSGLGDIRRIIQQMQTRNHNYDRQNRPIRNSSEHEEGVQAAHDGRCPLGRPRSVTRGVADAGSRIR